MISNALLEMIVKNVIIKFSSYIVLKNTKLSFVQHILIISIFASMESTAHLLIKKMKLEWS
jgi:hypothetical protein